MKWIRPPKLELYSFLYSMPVIDLAIHLIMYKDRVWSDINIWLISFPLLFIIGLVSWYCHVRYAMMIEKRYPALNQSGKRIIGKAFIVLFVMTPSILLILFVYNHFKILDYQVQDLDFVKVAAVGLSVNLIFETLYESDYMLGKYKETVLEKEAMQQAFFTAGIRNIKRTGKPSFSF